MVKKFRNKKGFTLIEIIAVLVILGILAAVAIPKYQNLQQEAKKKAVDGGIAAGMSALSLAYSKHLLTDGTTGGFNCAATVETSGDITVYFGGTSPNCIVTSAYKSDEAATQKSVTWIAPDVN